MSLGRALEENSKILCLIYLSALGPAIFTILYASSEPSYHRHARSRTNDHGWCSWMMTMDALLLSVAVRRP